MPATGVAEKTKPLGDAFINLVRMIIGPVIFCSVVHGVAGMNDMKRVGRVALKGARLLPRHYTNRTGHRPGGG